MTKTIKFFISTMNITARSCLLAWILGIFSHDCAAMDDEGRPHEHFCPITRDIMEDPVVAADGHSYERIAILQHFEGSYSPKSPLTGLLLADKKLVNNQALKTMIQDWKPPEGKSEPSVLEGRDAASIAEQVKEEFHKNATLSDAAKGQHIVAFLGNTGAGKSTLVNFLAGKEIVVSEDGGDYVLAHPEDKTAMVIGTAGNSETLYPKFIDVDGLRFFDLPGFNDTDGSERNLVNAAFIRKILLDAASVRLVFVAGQDQFTADRSASVKQMFACLKQLFVVDQDHINLVEDGVFVATKITYAAQTELTDFLLKKTNSRDKGALNEQLQSWSQRGKLCRMFHPLLDSNNKGAREEILGLIQKINPAKALGINVSVLYPPDTKKPLEKMFLRVIEEAFDRTLNQSLKFLSEYDATIAFHESDNFWQTFDAQLCQEERAIGLLKEFCINPYNEAMRNFEKSNEGKRQKHIQSLRSQRQQRTEGIEKMTETRAKKVISSFVPHPEERDFVFFDFAYHKDFYDQVCGAGSIQEITADAQEQEVARRYYAGFISKHSHDQMMRWDQKFSRVEGLTRQMATMVHQMAAMEKRLSEMSDNYARRVIKIEETLKALESRRAEEEKRSAEVATSYVSLNAPVTSFLRMFSKAEPSIPPVAQGYEEIYLRFLNGELIYRPSQESDVGMIRLRIRDLANPLEDTFDLSRCGDAGKDLSVLTGYRKRKKAENKGKLEVSIVLRFLIAKELETTASASHFKPIMKNWKPETLVGIFWTWGDWDDLNHYDYLTSQPMNKLGDQNLYEKWRSGSRQSPWVCVCGAAASSVARFTLLFVN